MNLQKTSTLNPDQEVRTTRPLSKEQVAQYYEDGFVIVRGLFEPNEVEPLRLACEEDPSIRDSQITVADADGNTYHPCIWHDLSNSYVGIVPRMARVVDAIELLMGEECYHWHSKIVMKRPYDSSRVEWHQGYGGWYDDGCVFPSLITCTIAINSNTKENGCLQVLKKSHLLGRLDHEMVGDTVGSNPERTKEVLKRLEVVDCEMESGDAIFFHANMMHASQPNPTDRLRVLLHCHYNAASNEPIDPKGQEHHLYQPLEKLSDSVIKNGLYNSVFDNQKFNKPGAGADGVWNWYLREGHQHNPK
ncbi:MAG: phytanoyl-CoA dioxygenase family protein [Microcoleaceae cyanobacterium]